MWQGSEGSAFEAHSPCEVSPLFTELTAEEMSSFNGGKSFWKRLFRFFEVPFHKAPLAPRVSPYWIANE